MPSPLSLSTSLLPSLPAIPASARTSTVVVPENRPALRTALPPIFDEAVVAQSPTPFRPRGRRPSNASRRLRQLLGAAQQPVVPVTAPSISPLAVPPATQSMEHQRPASTTSSTSSDNDQSTDTRERMFFPMYMPPYVRRRLPDSTSPGGRRVNIERANAEFFSRYEPHWRYEVSLLGPQRELRAAMARVGLRTSSDVQITHRRVEDTTIAVAQFRHWKDATRLGRFVLPSKAAVNASERL